MDWYEVVKFGKSYLIHITDRWQSLEVEEKIVYQGSIFPKKFHWDGNTYRTSVVLEVLRKINRVKNGDVSPEGIEPSTQSLKGSCSTPELRAQKGQEILYLKSN